MTLFLGFWGIDLNISDLQLTCLGNRGLRKTKVAKLLAHSSLFTSNHSYEGVP